MEKEITVSNDISIAAVTESDQQKFIKLQEDQNPFYLYSLHLGYEKKGDGYIVYYKGKPIGIINGTRYGSEDDKRDVYNFEQVHFISLSNEESEEEAMLHALISYVHHEITEYKFHKIMFLVLENSVEHEILKKYTQLTPGGVLREGFFREDIQAYVDVCLYEGLDHELI